MQTFDHFSVAPPSSRLPNWHAASAHLEPKTKREVDRRNLTNKQLGYMSPTHPKKKTWIPKIAIFERTYIFQTIIFGIYVKFRGCT